MTHTVSAILLISLSNLLGIYNAAPASPQVFRPHGFIVNGAPARDGEFPFLVRLQIVAVNQSVKVSARCGGTLVGPSVILTAAHCFIFEDATLREVRVFLGEYDVSKESPHKKMVLASRVSIHPGYDEMTTANDIAVVKLPQPIQKNQFWSWIPFATQIGMVPAGQPLIAAGWGAIYEGQSGASDILLKVDMALGKKDECKFAFPYFDPVKQVCSPVVGGRDTCQGDSGGPLVTKQGNEFVLVGITSHGAGCGRPGGYGYYTFPGSYHQWIEQNK